MGVKSFKNDRWNFLYEITKYGIIYFVLLLRFSTVFKAFFCLLVVYVLLIPSIVIAATDINVSDHLKTIFHLIYRALFVWDFQLFICIKKG
jgi:hypothetical protein